jgi:hypothetical protein
MPATDTDAGVALVLAETRGPTSLLGRIATARRSLATWAVHASGRFDRADSKWVTAFRGYVKACIFLTGTEAAGRTTTQFREGLRGVRGTWATCHLTGPAEGECWAAWDTRAAELEHAEARKLTDLTWVRSPEYGGHRAAKTHALVVRLRRVRGRRRRRIIFVVVHMPLDNTEQRARAWLDCCTGEHGLVHLVAELEAEFPDAAVVVVGDFNKNLRDPVEHAKVQRNLLTPMRRVTSWHKGLPAQGTLVGSRAVIDFAIAQARYLGTCQRLTPSAASDHVAIRYRLLGWLGRLGPRRAASTS